MAVFIPYLKTPEENLAAYIKAARIVHGFLQEDIAEMMRERGYNGYRQQTVSKIERTGLVNGAELLVLADILDISLDRLKVMGNIESGNKSDNLSIYPGQCPALSM